MIEACLAEDNLIARVGGCKQLFFFVPSQSSNERIRLLGYMSDILDAKAVS